MRISRGARGCASGTTRHGYGAGLHHFGDAERLENGDEPVDLVLGTRRFHDEGFRSDVDGARYAEIGRDAAGVFKAVIGVSIDVTVQAPGSLPRYELKAKRFFDHRPAGHRWQLAGRGEA